MSPSKVCPQCGSEYPLDQRFCPNDGSTLKTLGSSDLVGETIADRYYVLKKLGEGGMGQVYLAEHVKMGRKSAVKVMNPGMTQDADAIQRFNREAANASKINHPNVAAIYDFGETRDGLIYLAMEFIEGEALTDLIKRTGALAPARAAAIANQTAQGLAVAHDMGIVHRDLKPDNIMISRGRDGSDVVKVVDFGIAKAAGSEKQNVTKTGLVVGTPEYMSPEQLAGDKLDGRSDIYSLALVTFTMLTGKLPFPSETVQESMIMRLTDRPRTLTEITGQSHWPDALQAVLDRALAREAAERYATAGEFGRDLVKAVESMPQAAAAEAGTMVIGAPTVPKTRIGSAPPAASDRTVAVPQAGPPARPAAPPAPAARKRGPIVVIGGVVVAAAAAAAVMFSKGKEGAAVTPATDTARNALQHTSGVSTTKADTGRSAVPDAGTKTASISPNQSQPNGRTKQRETAVTRPAPARPALLSDSEMQALITRWDADAIVETRAAGVIREVNAYMPRIPTVEDSVRARYAEAVSQASLENPQEMCAILNRIKGDAQRTTQMRAVRLLLEQCQ